MKKLLFSQIIYRYKQEALENAISLNVINNTISSFRVYLKHYGKKEKDSSYEFAGFNNFEITLPKTANQIWKPSTVPSKMTAIKKIYRMYEIFFHEFQLNEKSEKFWELLRYYRKLRGFTRKELSKKIDSNVSACTIGRWERNDVFPALKFYKYVKDIEKVLNCQGILTSSLDRRLLYGIKKELIIKRNDRIESKKARFVRFNHYGLKYNDFPDSLKNEILDLFEFMTMDNVPLGLKRSNQWTKNYVENVVIKRFEAFFGFLILPTDSKDEYMRGMGYNKNDLELIMFVNPELLSEYKIFLKIRSKYGIESVYDSTKKKYIYNTVIIDSEGYYTKNLTTILAIAKTLIRNDDGYFVQREYLNYEFSVDSVELMRYITEEKITWTEWCCQSYNEIVKLTNVKYFRIGRNTKRPIKRLLQRDETKIIITNTFPDLIYNIKKRLPVKPCIKQLTIQNLLWSRRLLFVCLSYTFPLRVTQMARQTFSLENESNANFCKINGKWIWSLPRDQFKNAKHLSDEDIVIFFPGWLQKIFDDYIQIYRPRMVGGGKKEGKKYECDYIFRPCSPNAKNSDPLKPIDRCTLSNDSLAITALIPGTDGVRGHAIRLLLSNGAKAIGNIEMAAKLLNDTEKITEEFYSTSYEKEELEEYHRLTEISMNNRLNFN